MGPIVIGSKNMRAREFVVEGRQGADETKIPEKMHPDQIETLPAAHRVAGTADRAYDLNRVMMCVAMADGKTPPKMNRESWVGRNNTAHPYTPEELAMLRHAYQAACVHWDDALAPNPNNRSLEPKDTYKTSPVKPFQGYPR